MPNHITNRLRFNSNQLEEIKDFVSSVGEDGIIPFDFNKIIPMPEELNIESSSKGDDALFLITGKHPNQFMKDKNLKKLKDDFDKMSDSKKKEFLEIGQKYYNNIIKYGHTNWYDWSIANWGTKWNAYNFDFFEPAENEIWFQTAWSSPLRVIQKLSNLFPKIEIELTYADEDIGSNTGIITFKNGQPISINQPDDCSKEAYEILKELGINYE